MGRTGYTGQSIMLSDGLLLTAVPEGGSWLVNLVTRQVFALPSSGIAAERRNVSTSSVEGAVFAGVGHSGASTRAHPNDATKLYPLVNTLSPLYCTDPCSSSSGANNLCAAGRRDLSEFVLRKADEETGHDRLALLDLEALGLPEAEVIRLIQPPSASVLVSKLRGYVKSPEPIALLGFSYCMERMTIEKDETFISSIDEICSPKSASRFLRVHSGTGNDRDHTNEQLTLFETLDFDELTIVARAAFETAKTIATLDTIYQTLSDEEINNELNLSWYSNICRTVSGKGGAERAFVMT